MRILQPARWRYLIRGAATVWQRRWCPCCGASEATQVDRKWVYTLNECESCRVLYRHPRETADRMHEFYQGEYSEPGLTTELPSPDELARLLENHFAGSPKDVTRVCVLLQALGLQPGQSVLDFGANWGYGTYQLRRAGFEAEAFEVSKPRAAFGRNLGIEIHTSTDAVPGPFDAVYSSHVLEHLPNPLETLRDMLQRIRPGGFVVAHTPNGSAARREGSFARFHSNWGRVHPTLLSDRFVLENFPDQPVFLSTSSDPAPVRAWGRDDRLVEETGGEELFFAIRRSP